MRTGLVLSGGGLLAVGWELGVLRGMQDGGVDRGRFDVVIGTSAGAIAGAIAASGAPLEAIAPVAERDQRLAALLGQADPALLATVWPVLGSGGTSDQARRAEVGAVARKTRIAEDDYVEAIRPYVPQGWPEPLVIAAVDAGDGTFTAWGVDAGVPMVRAAAASAAVPGLFPPVTIGGRRYMDGAVRSPTSADLAANCDLVVIVAAPSRSADSDRQIATETAAVRAAGGEIIEIRPDEESGAAFGADPFDSQRQALVFDAGRRQGAAAARRVASRGDSPAGQEDSSV
jgi:NTE family protein